MATKLSADDISRLFDIKPGPNLDIESPDTDSSGTRRPFKDTCEDLKAVMEPDPPLEVAKPIPDTDTVPNKVAPKVNIVPPVEEVVLPAQKEDSDNPLGLSGNNLDAYNDLCRDHPQFCLYDGSQSFKDFYRHKVIFLKSLLSTFPILPLVDYLKELGEVCLNNQVGNATVSPELIRKKIDDVGISRTRVVEILSEALSQFPVWEKSTNLLSGKLWKDHESKGAHKRDGLCAEHMQEMVLYVEKLKGFIDAAKTIDGFLKSTSDGLSRQLACIVTRQNAGIASDSVLPEMYTSRDTTLDGFDTVSEGTVIKEAQSGGALIHHDFGVPAASDEFADIG